MPRLLKMILIIIPFPVFAQSGVEISADAVFGFQTSELEIWNDVLDEYQCSGFRAQAAYTYRKDEGNFEAIGRIGLKFLNSSGSYGNDSFEAKTTKLLINAGARYWVMPKFSLQLMAGIENNRDFDDWRVSTADNLRYNGEFTLNYSATEKILISVGYTHEIYPVQNQYLIYNPQHQLNIGASFILF